MSPDSVESRLGRLEQGLARLEQRVDDLATDVRVMAPLIVQMAEQRIAMQHMQNELHDCATGVAKLRQEIQDEREAIEKRREGERTDNRRNRWAVAIAVMVVVLTTVGGLIVQIVTAGP